MATKALDYDRYLIKRCLLLALVLMIGFCSFIAQGASKVHAVINSLEEPVSLAEAINWNHQKSIPMPRSGQETATQLAETVHRLFHSERTAMEFIEIPQDQEVYVMGKVPLTDYTSFYPAAASLDSYPVRVCTIEKRALLSQVASEDGRALFIYGAPNPKYYDPDTPNRCQGNELLLEELKDS